jgi:trk system potassium uptake protein TrkA
MKIVIADGLHEADYLINLFNRRGNNLIVINRDEKACHYLSERNNIPVIHRSPVRENNLLAAGVKDADLFIALSQSDIKNYVACKTAKQLLGVKRCIATVVNPKNVALLKKLGVDAVLCATYLLGEQIHTSASLDSLINSLSLEDNKIQILELRIKADDAACGKSLEQLNLSGLASISCIYRHDHGIIPNGKTVLQNGDKVLLVTTAESRDHVTALFRRKRV